jgi:hypothetical protein
MFDLRKFWLAATIYGLIIVAVTVAVGATLSAFIGLSKEHRQSASQTAPARSAPLDGPVPSGAETVGIRQEVVPPAALVRPSLDRSRPASNIPAGVPQIIAPERNANKR